VQNCQNPNRNDLFPPRRLQDVGRTLRRGSPYKLESESATRCAPKGNPPPPPLQTQPQPPTAHEGLRKALSAPLAHPFLTPVSERKSPAPGSATRPLTLPAAQTAPARFWKAGSTMRSEGWKGFPTVRRQTLTAGRALTRCAALSSARGGRRTRGRAGPRHSARWAAAGAAPC